MILKNSIGDFSLIVPDFLVRKISLFTSCKLTEKELSLFESALELLANDLQTNNVDKETIPHAICIFMDNNEYTMIFEDSDDVFGLHKHIIIYRMEKIRTSQSKIYYLVPFIEELCHCYYSIHNEIEVSHKVVKIIQTRFPEIEPHQLYPPHKLGEVL